MDKKRLGLMVLCVLRSGGDFNETYALALYYAVLRNLTLPFDFLCLSDMNVDCPSEPLREKWRGWWSKIEMFRFQQPVLYLDLDTVILGSLDPLAKKIITMPDNQFLMLRAFSKKRNWASGVMGWNGDFSYIYHQFRYRQHIKQWDQDYISSKLLAENMCIQSVQDYLPGMYSYKKHCRDGQPPDDAQVILFHGKPRPHECKEDWIKENWA